MIVGESETPYAGGFFHFMFRFGPQYPFEPPRVCCMTSYRFGCSVRFHPNLYVNGYVCLSLLGTWDGPRWSAANNLSSVLLSIQSILTSNALCHEPGMEKFRGKNDSKDFDVYARHETLRVAVLQTVKYASSYKLPEKLIKVMRRVFLENFDSYICSCDELAPHDKRVFPVSLLSKKGSFKPRFGQLKLELIELKQTLDDMVLCPRPIDMSSDASTGAKPKKFAASSRPREFSSLSELETSLPVSSTKVPDDSPQTIKDGSDLWSNSDEEESDGDSYVPSEDDDPSLDDSAISLADA
ncbi:Ubiquitin-conjugating enzyme E2 [Trinorchestia longiramus]|nr:Ubiquitin-conjugating enzyme E2 [Trinorchestia longiramus]